MRQRTIVRQKQIFTHTHTQKTKCWSGYRNHPVCLRQYVWKAHLLNGWNHTDEILHT